VSKQSSHKSLIKFVNWVELWNIVVFIFDVGVVLFVDKISCLFFNREIYDASELLPPYFFTLNIQKILNVLNTSFETDKIGTQASELNFVVTESAHSTLLRMVNSCFYRSNWLSEDKFLMKHLRHSLAELFFETVD
jgi:hypothetical protein